VKEDVAKDIPPKEETIIDVELTTMQKQYYRAIYEHNHGFLMQNLKGSMPKLMNIQMELRKCCNHPFLVQGVEDTEMDGVDEKMMKGRANSMSSDEGAEAPVARGAASGARLTAEARERNLKRDKEYKRLRMETSFIPSSGKMVLLDKLLPKLQKEGHKVLIFSQMVRMIDYIEEYCNFREYPCERLDGRVSGNDRQKSIDRFNKEENSFVFLLSTRAGGVGINLTAADTCIIFDSDWNPQNDVQAMARCHRIGQKKQVTIYRLITRKSFEAEMFDRASRKLGLEQAVLGTRQFDAIEMDEAQEKKDKVDTKEMEQLLREGAYAVLMEEDDGEAEDFLADDIDKILQKRSHTTVTEAGPTTESWLNKKKKRGRTKKSVFKGQDDGDAAEIDVNDPDFWKKVLPDLVTPESMQEAYQTQFEGATEPAKQGEIRKYFKDLSQMMKGLLDLNSRGTLPDKEKEVCMNLLLLISINESMFSEKDRVQANTWLAAIEGSRSRKQRIDLSSPAKKGKKKGDGDSAALGGGGRKSRSNGNVIYKDEGEDSDVELDMYGLAIPKKRKRMSKKEKAAKAAAGDTGEDYLDDPELLDDDEAFVYAAEDDDEAYGGKGTGKGRGRPKGALDKKQRKRKGEGQPRKKKKSKKQLEEEQAHGADLDDDDSLNDVTAAALKRNRAVPKRKSAESVHFDDGGATDSDDDIFGGGPRPPPAKKANKTERAMHSKKVREVLKGHFSGQATAEPDYDEDDSDDPYSMN
jgi:superfamily II DNA/RNA helicase